MWHLNSSRRDKINNKSHSGTSTLVHANVCIVYFYYNKLCTILSMFLVNVVFFSSFFPKGNFHCKRDSEFLSLKEPLVPYFPVKIISVFWHFTPSVWDGPLSFIFRINEDLTSFKSCHRLLPDSQIKSPTFVCLPFRFTTFWNWQDILKSKEKGHPKPFTFDQNSSRPGVVKRKFFTWWDNDNTFYTTFITG